VEHFEAATSGVFGVAIRDKLWPDHSAGRPDSNDVPVPPAARGGTGQALVEKKFDPALLSELVRRGIPESRAGKILSQLPDGQPVAILRTGDRVK
jgi:hypothetical protein